MTCVKVLFLCSELEQIMQLQKSLIGRIVLSHFVSFLAQQTKLFI